MSLDQQKSQKSNFKNWKVTHQYMVLERRRANQSSRSSLQTTKKNTFQPRCLIAEIAEQDTVQGNALHMERHATIVRGTIISRTCADRKRKFMGLEKKSKSTTATQTCLLEPSPPGFIFKMMNVL